MYSQHLVSFYATRLLFSSELSPPTLNYNLSPLPTPLFHPFRLGLSPLLCLSIHRLYLRLIPPRLFPIFLLSRLLYTTSHAQAQPLLLFTLPFKLCICSSRFNPSPHFFPIYHLHLSPPFFSRVYCHDIQCLQSLTCCNIFVTALQNFRKAALPRDTVAAPNTYSIHDVDLVTLIFLFVRAATGRSVIPTSFY